MDIFPGKKGLGQLEHVIEKRALIERHQRPVKVWKATGIVAFVAFGAIVAFVAFVVLVAFVTFVAFVAFLAFVVIMLIVAFVAFGAIVAFVAFVALVAFVAFVASVTSVACSLKVQLLWWLNASVKGKEKWPENS